MAHFYSLITFSVHWRGFLSKVYIIVYGLNSLWTDLEIQVIKFNALIQLSSYKRFLQWTLIQWRLSIYPWVPRRAEGTFFWKSMVSEVILFTWIKNNKRYIVFLLPQIYFPSWAWVELSISLTCKGVGRRLWEGRGRAGGGYDP